MPQQKQTSQNNRPKNSLTEKKQRHHQRYQRNQTETQFSLSILFPTDQYERISHPTRTLHL